MVAPSHETISGTTQVSLMRRKPPQGAVKHSQGMGESEWPAPIQRSALRRESANAQRVLQAKFTKHGRLLRIDRPWRSASLQMVAVQQLLRFEKIREARLT